MYVSAVRQATSRKAREVAHPQLFRSMFRDKPALYFSVEVAHPPADLAPPIKKQVLRSAQDDNLELDLCSFDQLRADFRSYFCPRPQPIPEHNRDQREHKDDGGDGVDFWGDASAEASPDFQGEGVVTADQEEAYGDFVHGKGEDQERRSDDGELEIGNRDAPEGLPVVGAEIERGFFLGAIEFLQSGKDFGGGDGNQRGAVSEDYGDSAESYFGYSEQH